jgi:hypothetical protein
LRSSSEEVNASIQGIVLFSYCLYFPFLLSAYTMQVLLWVEFCVAVKYLIGSGVRQIVFVFRAAFGILVALLFIICLVVARLVSAGRAKDAYSLR